MFSSQAIKVNGLLPSPPAAADQRTADGISAAVTIAVNEGLVDEYKGRVHRLPFSNNSK